MKNDVLKGWLGIVTAAYLVGCGQGPSLKPNQGTQPGATGAISQAEQLGEIPVSGTASTGISGYWERSNTACDNGFDTTQSNTNLSFGINGATGYAVLKYAGTSPYSGLTVSIPLNFAFANSNATSGTVTVTRGTGPMSCKDTSGGGLCSAYTSPTLPSVLNYGLTGTVLTLTLDSDIMCNRAASIASGYSLLNSVVPPTPPANAVAGFSSTANFNKVN